MVLSRPLIRKVLIYVRFELMFEVSESRFETKYLP